MGLQSAFEDCKELCCLDSKWKQGKVVVTEQIHDTMSLLAWCIVLLKVSFCYRMKMQEISCAYEVVDNAGTEQAKIESEFKEKIRQLENDLKMAQRSMGGRDTRFLRDEIRQLESHLERKEKELVQLEKEMSKERKTNEEISKIKHLKKKTEQLQQDVEFYRKELEQKDALQTREESNDMQKKINRSNQQAYHYMECLQNSEDMNAILKSENQHLQKNLEESVKEMEKMTEEYNKMKIVVQQTDGIMDQLRKERDQANLQVRELTEQIQARAEEDDPVMAAVSAKVEEWKSVLSGKDAEILEYQQMIHELREKLRTAQTDSDKSNILILQQAVQDRDHQIKLLSERVEQYTGEMERNASLIEELKKPIKKDKELLGCAALLKVPGALRCFACLLAFATCPHCFMAMRRMKETKNKPACTTPLIGLCGWVPVGLGSTLQQRKLEELNSRLQAAERRAKQAERVALLAETDARDKDKELSESLSRIRLYESGTAGLEAAIAEIKDCKNQLRMRDREIEAMTREINQLELKINDLLDENEELRERLGLNAKEEVDLTEFRRSKALKQRQYRAENQVLLKEIERLEEERLELKQRIRSLVKDKGVTVVSSSLLDDSAEEGTSMSIGERPILQSAHEEVKWKNDFLQKEMKRKDKELELKIAESSQFKAKLNEMMKENKQLEQGMKEIHQAIQEAQDTVHSPTALSIPSLERLVSVLEMKYSNGKSDLSAHLRAQLDQLTGRNEELRQEMKTAREEAAISLAHLAKAQDKVVLLVHLLTGNIIIVRLEGEVEAAKLSAGTAILPKTLPLPEEMAPPSVQIVNSLNEYMIHLLQEMKNKEESVKQLDVALEEYKRKFAILRHQQGLLYKEYQSEKESWEKERDLFAEMKAKMEEQKDLDAVKITEHNRWLEAMQQDPAEIRRQVSEAARKMTVLRVNEKTLSRRYTTLMEQEQHLRKENNRLKGDFTQMEVAVTERVGYLQRFKEMAVFKMAVLQKSLDDSVPLSELERANKQYNVLTVKYRDLLQKDNRLVQRTTMLEHLESENISLREHISSVTKELEITKEKLHTLEQAWENNTTGGDSSMDKAAKALANSELVAVSKRITTLEMKELNERQRAEHAQKMYEHVRSSLTQMEERNSELEDKFAQMAKQNLEAQRVERELRDELADSVSKEVSDADRRRIAELERSEAQLRTEVSKLREVSDVAKMQVSALEARQKSREKEVESLRRQVLDYQAQSDEKALIAKLHQHIVALQLSETAAVGRLEASAARLRVLEAQKLRAEQQLDAQRQALWQTRQEGRQRARHLRHALQALRRQFSGALPLAQQERFSSTMLQLQADRLRACKEARGAQEERRTAEGRAQELELQLKGLEELMATLKDAKGAQKVSEWHKKLEETRLQELRKNRELVAQREEIRYLKNMVAEQEHTVSTLEEELVQQNNVCDNSGILSSIAAIQMLEEQQLSCDQREVELERQLEAYEKQQNQIIGSAQKFEEATASLPDPSQPLAHQLDHALSKIKEHVRTILDTQATCKTLEEKLKEKEAALWQAEQNVLSRDRVINELRLRLPAAAERERLLADLSKQDELDSQPALRVAHQSISNLQSRLDQKEGVLKKYQNLLAKARQEQEQTAKRHEEELKSLHQKLDLHTDMSLKSFRQTALDLMKKPTIAVPTTKQLARLAEMEQMVAEQDTSLSSLTLKLKELTAELDKERQLTASQAQEHMAQMAKLENRHASQMKTVSREAEELRAQVSRMEKELQYLHTELEVQKEANMRSPSNTMKNLVERLKAQLALKEKQQKALSKALLDLRAEMTSHAEQQIIANAAQKEESLNIQQIVDKQTKELMSRVKEQSEELHSMKETMRAGKARESSLKEELESLSKELQRSQKSQSRLQKEREALEEQLDELKQKVKRLSSGFQGQTESEVKGPSIEILQKKIRRLETELDKKSVPEPVEKKTTVKDEKSHREELVRWEEGKKWQAKMEKVRNILKEKEKETDSLSKQLATLKELYGRLEQEKVALQKKLKSRGVTADQVVGTRTLEAEKEVEELKKINFELEQQMEIIKQQQALPRDAAMEDMNLRNLYLEEKLHSLESQLARESSSRPSTSGRGSGSPSQRKHELQKENLKLSTENLELHFQLEQANKDLPRLKSGRSGKTVPELEKTIVLMKRVVEKVQRENESLRKNSATNTQEQLTTLEKEHEKLKAECDRMKEKMEIQLASKLESKTKGMEKIVIENERLRKEIKKEFETTEKLKVEKASLEVKNENLRMELEETKEKFLMVQSKGPSMEGADSKSWKSMVVTRLFENKIKVLESENAKKDTQLSQLKTQLTEAHEEEQKMQRIIDQLKEHVELMNIPIEATTDEGLAKEFQTIRLANHQLEKEKAHLLHQIQKYEEQYGTSLDGPAYKDLQTKLEAVNAEKCQLQEEVTKMSKELVNFDPAFFEELEDLKFNYNVENCNRQLSDLGNI
ncbi:hypothetical protein P4O66_003906 [Electrophorus voltai]|uniref:Centrosomal protein of 290kDa coiled-coil region domain-containing protein n=1 Tax=Electrophorus voltai TaxID=2609070 RepID=A0AAD9E3R7_9TELE|nr:hypothetical protein P4O66_003906 [Electrophorus voltai]